MVADLLFNVVILVVAGAVIFALWKSRQPQRIFRIRIRDGEPQATEGKVTSAFLEHIREVAVVNAISSGTITGYALGKFIRIGFSKEIDQSARQQLRNWWATFGWSAPPKRRSGCAG